MNRPDLILAAETWRDFGAMAERERIFREVVGPLVEALEFWLPDESDVPPVLIKRFYDATDALAKARAQMEGAK